MNNVEKIWTITCFEKNTWGAFWKKQDNKRMEETYLQKKQLK